MSQDGNTRGVSPIFSVLPYKDREPMKAHGRVETVGGPHGWSRRIIRPIAPHNFMSASTTSSVGATKIPKEVGSCS